MERGIERAIYFTGSAFMLLYIYQLYAENSVAFSVIQFILPFGLFYLGLRTTNVPLEKTRVEKQRDEESTIKEEASSN